jgi:hypothetical protein
MGATLEKFHLFWGAHVVKKILLYKEIGFYQVSYATSYIQVAATARGNHISQ